jgi:hypothetical protein
MGEVDLQIFLSEDRLRQTFEALSLFENEVFLVRARSPTIFERDVVQLLYLPAIVRIFLWVRGRSEI